MIQPVETVREIGDRRVHRFQVVREHRPGDADEDWIVVDFGEDVVRVADPAFDWTDEFSAGELRDGTVEPLVAGEVPVWGY